MFISQVDLVRTSYVDSEYPYYMKFSRGYIHFDFLRFNAYIAQQRSHGRMSRS